MKTKDILQILGILAVMAFIYHLLRKRAKAKAAANIPATATKPAIKPFERPAWIGKNIIENIANGSIATTFAESPQLVDVSTTDDGLQVELTFDKPMQDPAAFVDDISLKINGDPDIILSVALDPGDDTKFIIEQTTLLAFGDVITVSIATGNIKSVEGGKLATLTDQAVTNIVPEPEI